MQLNKITISIFFLAVLILGYGYLILKLIDSIMAKPRLKGLGKISVIIINMVIGMCLVVIPMNTSTAYVMGAIILLFNFYIFHKDTFVKSLFCMSACILHVMAIRAICVAVFAVAVQSSIYQIVMDPYYSIWSNCLSFLLLDLAVFGVLKLIPSKSIRIVSQYNTQLWFMIVWMTVFNIYLFVNSRVYNHAQEHPDLVANQILAPIVILIGLYVVLFFAMKTSRLLAYKDKSEELQGYMNNEQQYRESMMSDALVTYEFNVSNNTVIQGFEEYRELPEYKSYSYSDILTVNAKNLIHPHDFMAFAKYAMPLNLINEFKNGKNEISIEYRRLLPNEDYIWAKATTNLVKDAKTGDIKGFTYVKNIDKEKRRQIELVHKAERDSLTGLYNKGTTGKLVAERLNEEHRGHSMSAMYIIDVDNFKLINDNLGHTYGDAVLCELSEKLQNLFGKDDVVGRIGGDEFMAFMLKGENSKHVELKAKEICKAFYKTYRDENNKEYTVSSSIGIAVYPRNGRTFEELFRCSDVALYISKSKGKNTFNMYHGEEFVGYESNRTEIDSKGQLLQKNFKQNRIEYVFKILYASDNPINAIYSVLELVTSHFGFDRGYIFESSEDETTTSNTFEWCREGINPEIDSLQKVPIEAVATANASFHKSGMFMVKSLKDLQPLEREVLEPQGIKSMFQFGIFDKNILLGFIVFDNCIKESMPTNEDLEEMFTICNILATFFVKQKITEHSAKSLAALTAVMNNLDSFTYVIAKDTYETLFMNEKTAKLIGGTFDKSTPCYRLFRDQNKPCRDCPVQGLTEDIKSKCSVDMYNSKFSLWTETTASNIEWTDGQPSCLIYCVDISKYKNLIER